MALFYACDDVEMAVAGTVQHEWGYEFGIATIEGYPGVLIVRRLDPPSVFHASATIGRFENHPQRASELVAAFNRQMLAFGKKRQFNN